MLLLCQWIACVFTLQAGLLEQAVARLQHSADFSRADTEPLVGSRVQ